MVRLPPTSASVRNAVTRPHGSERRASQCARLIRAFAALVNARVYRWLVRSVTAKSVLGGPWAASPAIWLVLFGPASLLVIMEQSVVDFRAWWGLPVSALAQHAVSGLVILVLVVVLRRFLPLIPVPLIIAIWVLGGVARGLVSGWLVEALSSSPPDYAHRVLFWAVICAVWLPLSVYAASQLDLRATLMSSIITLRMDIELEHAEADTSEREREGRLLSAVATALAPVIAEIRLSLEAALAGSRRPLATISDKIESVVDTVLDIIVHEPIRAAPRSRTPRRLLAPLTAALRFDSSRPVFASALVSVAAAALLLPDSLRFGGMAEVLDVAMAIAAGGVVMALLLLALDRLARRVTIAVWHVSVVLLLALLTSVAVFLATCEYPLGIHDLTRVFAIPASIAASALTISAAVGLSFANLDVVPEEARLIEELAELRQLAALREEATREQFTALMHGPVLGRLSACVMALNFHASGGSGTEESRATVAAQVIAHLELVAADLDQMMAPREYT